MVGGGSLYQLNRTPYRHAFSGFYGFGAPLVATQWPRRVHDEHVHDVAEVLNELADTIPNLPGARCKGHAELFDRTIAYPHSDHRTLTDMAREQALFTCSICPVLDRCREWFEALAPEQRPRGVVAGRLNAPGQRRGG